MMRPLEAAILLLSVPLLLGALSGRPVPPSGRLLPVVALAVVAVHAAVEGVRWHMAAGYLVAAGSFVAFTWPRFGEPGRWVAVAGLAALAAAWAIGTLLPVFDLPEPTGPFRIGTVTRHLTDPARSEARGPAAGGRRELLVQVWYPADQAGPAKAYRSRAETTLKKSHLALVRTHAAADVPVAVASPRYPVLIFSPSWIGRRNQNTVQAEELASHGFVVVGIDHPYSTDLTLFPDGRVVHSRLGEALDFSTDRSLQDCLAVADEELESRTADVRFVLDEFERLDRHDPAGLFTGRLDTTRVGVFGHSFGGAVAAEVCRTDPRIKAGINLDGYLFGPSKAKGVGKPFLMIGNDVPAPTPAEVAAATGPRRRELEFIVDTLKVMESSVAQDGGPWLTVRGAQHVNFCDSPLYTPVKRLTRAGSIPPRRGFEVINAYVLAFFRAALVGEASDLLAGPCPRYPEVIFEPIPPAAQPGR